MSRSHIATPPHVALWDAIDGYAYTVGGDPSGRVYGNTQRQKAVAAVERAVDELLAAARCYCGQPIACNHEAHPELSR